MCILIMYVCNLCVISKLHGLREFKGKCCPLLVRTPKFLDALRSMISLYISFIVNCPRHSASTDIYVTTNQFISQF